MAHWNLRHLRGDSGDDLRDYWGAWQVAKLAVSSSMIYRDDDSSDNNGIAIIIIDRNNKNRDAEVPKSVSQ